MSVTSSDEPDDEPVHELDNEPDEDPGEEDPGRVPMGAPILVNDETLVEAIVIGMSNAEIAEVLEVSVRTISRRRNRPEVRRAIRRRSYEVNADLRSEFRTLAPMAMRAFKDSLEFGDSKIRLAAARVVMDRIFQNQRDDLEDQVRALESADGPGEVLDDSEWPEDAA